MTENVISEREKKSENIIGENVLMTIKLKP